MRVTAGGSMTVLLRLLGRAVSALGLLAFSADAAPEDVSGWQGARWGMTTHELEAVFGRALEPLAAGWRFGGAYAERAMFGLSLGGVSFAVFFQMNEASNRLQQVLLERRPPQASPTAYRTVVGALEDRYGPPTDSCGDRGLGGRPARVELVWRFPTTTVHAAFFDFYSSAVVFEDPNVDPDPLTPYVETRRNNPRFLPRRIAIRFHPTTRRDLGGCSGGRVDSPSDPTLE